MPTKKITELLLLLVSQINHQSDMGLYVFHMPVLYLIFLLSVSQILKHMRADCLILYNYCLDSMG